MEDTNTPLVVAGSTKVVGKAILPRQGVKAGNIVGNYYQGSQLIYGAISNTASKKPSISNEKLTYLQSLLFRSIPINSAQELSLDQNYIAHTFQAQPRWLYRRGNITLGNQSISDNIIIKSDSLIRVTAFAKAKNIVLVAPHIIIEKNVTGNFQAIASKSILLEENTSLSYPSALILVENPDLKDERTTQHSGIVMKESASIDGSVVHLSQNTEHIKAPKISIEEGALVRGEIYSKEWLELFGTIQGTVFTHQLAARVRGSIYKNHLFNATINATQLPKEFGGLTLSKANKTIVQWVD